MLEAYGKIRIATEPVVELANGTSVAKFRGSSSEAVKAEDGGRKFHNHYFDFVVWGTAAEYIKKNCPKGTDLFVKAIARENRWVTEDGQNRSKPFYRIQSFSELKPPVAKADGAADMSEVGSYSTDKEESPF